MAHDDIRQQAYELLLKHTERHSPLLTADNTSTPAKVLNALVEALQTPVPMSEDEMLQRARRAGSALVSNDDDINDMWLSGKFDSSGFMACLLTVLRDLDKPLVDPIDERLRELVYPDVDDVLPGDEANRRLRKAYEMGKADAAR